MHLFHDALVSFAERRGMYMKNILWISLNVPYDTVGHAGGKIHNFYLKEIKKTKEYAVYLISICYQSEKKKITLDKYGVENNLIYYGENLISKIIREIINFPRRYIFINSEKGFLSYHREISYKRKVKEYCKSGNKPDIIILQWTQTALLLPYLKKVFPLSRYVCIEEDVAYQGMYRKYQMANGVIKKRMAFIKYVKLKQYELKILKKADLVVTNNSKDERMLEKEGIDTSKLFLMCPFFENYAYVSRNLESKKIIFYGAMNREENYKSVIWFIENVFKKIENLELELWVVGNKPVRDLFKYKSKKIIITGYVENIANIFSDTMCMIAPLLLGAGIKIKILEAMSAGIPVITNTIGIEGINAEAGIDYLHCEKPEEYIKAIKSLVDNKMIGQKIGRSGREYIIKNFCKEKAMKPFIEKLEIINNL